MAVSCPWAVALSAMLVADVLLLGGVVWPGAGLATASAAVAVMMGAMTYQVVRGRRLMRAYEELDRELAVWMVEVARVLREYEELSRAVRAVSGGPSETGPGGARP